MNISASMKQFSINLFLHKLKFPKELRFNEICTTCRSLANASLKITTPFKLHRLEKGPDRQVSVTKQDAVSMYTKMTVIRRLETIASSLYKEKAIRGFCHLYSGQEAVAVGMHAAMRKGDGLTTSYRCHPWVWLFGGTYEQLLGELCGKVIGSSRGKGGSMHVYSKDFYGGNGIVGAQVPLGTGVGLANHYFKNGKVSFVLYGDGAANQGQVFESYNMAKLWTLPVIYVCENNKYGMGTSMQRSSASYTYYTRGDYIPGLQVDGMDVLATREATLFAIAHCIADKGPIVLEMTTYRYFGHSMSDPGTSYRSRDEVQQVRQTMDPINIFKGKIIEAKLVDKKELQAIDESVKKDVDEALKKVRAAPPPPIEELSADISKNNLEPYIRGTQPWQRLKHMKIAK